ncbi:hypothetical protein LEP1GSC165_3997 [Leptospira santarosai str. CBC523]|uniref:hypothetical protein n=1 Tax=Leptospira santarosai TaxID=28183 RepID=UPI0002BD3DAB|nr:hypothetical protein [Leptospira santarosai]EMO12324.1 hypothetical protein LEP1GSC165_3997 [Leptospira santarosai str. CBC523]
MHIKTRNNGKIAEVLGRSLNENDVAIFESDPNIPMLEYNRFIILFLFHKDKTHKKTESKLFVSSHTVKKLKDRHLTNELSGPVDLSV